MPKITVKIEIKTAWWFKHIYIPTLIFFIEFHRSLYFDCNVNEVEYKKVFMKAVTLKVNNKVVKL